MKICVTPPPRFPQPPEMPCAVPTTSGTKMIEDQYCVHTKVEPTTPMKKRMVMRPSAVVTRGARKVQRLQKRSRSACTRFGPKRSQSGPTTKRAATVDDTEQTFARHMSLSRRSRSSFSTEESGAKANHPRKAMKKENHEKWKERICGRWTDRRFSDVALKPRSESTFSFGS